MGWGMAVAVLLVVAVAVIAWRMDWGAKAPPTNDDDVWPDR
jgi:ABC-type uncharacterized transport system permease subunit